MIKIRSQPVTRKNIHYASYYKGTSYVATTHKGGHARFASNRGEARSKGGNYHDGVPENR